MARRFQPTFTSAFFLFLSSLSSLWPSSAGATGPGTDLMCFMDPPADMMNMALACVAKAAATAIDYGGPNFPATGYNDQCLALCFFNSAKMLDANGEAVESLMQAQLMTITPAQNQDRAKAGLTACIASTKQQIDSQGGAKAQGCKYAAMLAHCAVQSAVGLCKPA